MSQNQNIIPVMFEEIKQILHKILQKLDNLQNTTKPTETNRPTDDARFKHLEQQLQQIPKPDLERIERGQSVITQNCKVLFNIITQQDEKLKEILNRLEQQNSQRPVQKHLHTIEIKSSKVVITIVGLSLFLFLSLTGIFINGKRAPNYPITTSSTVISKSVMVLIVKTFVALKPSLSMSRTRQNRNPYVSLL